VAGPAAEDELSADLFGPFAHVEQAKMAAAD
jgi:hypothetical protein